MHLSFTWSWVQVRTKYVLVSLRNSYFNWYFFPTIIIPFDIIILWLLSEHQSTESFDTFFKQNDLILFITFYCWQCFIMKSLIQTNPSLYMSYSYPIKGQMNQNLEIFSFDFNVFIKYKINIFWSFKQIGWGIVEILEC